MELWQRRGIGILTLGGGAIGVALGVQLILSNSSPVAWFFCAVFVAVYSWGVWCGLRFLEGDDSSVRSVLKYWMLQVPSFGSPFLGYVMTSGFHATVSFQILPPCFSGNLLLGSSFKYSLMQAGTPWSIGVNVFALVISIWLFRIRRSSPLN